jgi:shikimate dehydrogenase
VTVYLGVCGWPVGHSRSPAMQNAALAAAGLSDWRYLALPLPPDELAETVRALPAAGFRGVNVTIPHKEAALALATTASEAAREIGAANTLTFEPGGAIAADNTDAPGLLAALGERCDPAGRTALVLGAGGAARAAVWALLRGGASAVEVWNRTPERARALAAELGARAVQRPSTAQIVVNCTSVGLADPAATFKALPLQADSLGAGSCVVDMVYRDGGTRLLEAARTRGADVIDGLEILIAQGAASFERWTGRTAPRQAMRDAVRPSPAHESASTDRGTT